MKEEKVNNLFKYMRIIALVIAGIICLVAAAIDSLHATPEPTVDDQQESNSPECTRAKDGENGAAGSLNTDGKPGQNGQKGTGGKDGGNGGNGGNSGLG